MQFFFKDLMTVLVESPSMWIDIDVLNLFHSYVFDGSIDDKEEDFIYFDIIASHLLFPLEALVTSEVDYTEISIVKNNIAPFLKVYAKPVAEGNISVFNSQIPIISKSCFQSKKSITKLFFRFYSITKKNMENSKDP